MQILYERDIIIKSLYELLFEYINDIINLNFDQYFNEDIDESEKENNLEFLLVDMSGRNDSNFNNNNRFSNLAANYAFDLIQNNINKRYIREMYNDLGKEIENLQFMTDTNDYKQSLNIISDKKDGIISILDYIRRNKYHKSDSAKIFDEMVRKNKNSILETDETKFMLNHYPYNIAYNTESVFDDSQYFNFEPLIELLKHSSLSISNKLIHFYSEHKLFNFGESFALNRIESIIYKCFQYLFDDSNQTNKINNCNQSSKEWDSQIISQQCKAFHIPQILNIQSNILPFSLNKSEIANKFVETFGNENNIIELNEYNQSLLIIALFNVFDIKPSQYKIGKTNYFQLI